jgi:hypothetical protein
MNHFSVRDLEVIGFTEVPALRPPLPRVLSAIFREPASGKVLYPPYLLDRDTLLNPVVATQEDFAERVALNEITRCDAQPAEVEWAYWLDDEGKVHYEPLSLITRKLDDIFERRIQAAKARLAAHDYPAARDHALIAAAVNPQHLTPLVLRAAAECCMTRENGKFPDSRDELELTEELASAFISVELFREEYRREIARAIPPSSKIRGAAVQPSHEARFFVSCSPRCELAAA